MNLLSIELIKTKRLGNYIMLGIVLLISILLSAFYFHILSKHHVTGAANSLFGLDAFQNTIVSFVFVVFVIMNIGKEYTDKTLRRAIIDGYNRDLFFTGKIIITLTFTVILFVLLKLVLVSCALITGQASLLTDYLTFPILVNQFLSLLTNGIIGFFLVFLTQSVAISIIIYFVWITLENILASMLPQVWDGWQPDYINYFPLKVIQKMFSPAVADTQVIVMAMIYLTIMLVLPYFLFLKRDIK